MNTNMKVLNESRLAGDEARNDKNALRRSNRQILIEGLKQDLAREHEAILMYIHYSALVTGPFRQELRALFQAEIGADQAHAQFLADKITALGGDPTTDPRQVVHANRPRVLLEEALSAEIQATAEYRTRIEQAKACGDVGLTLVLENQVIATTRHKEQIERILAGWDELNVERKHNEDRWQDDGGQG